MHCVHFSSGQCRSCEWLATPYADQLKLKASHLEQLFAGRKAGQWLPFFQSEKHAFRNKAKMVALGVAQDPVLGIISPAGESVNLTDCPLYSPEMRNLLQALPGLIRRAGIPPYRIDKKKGELKYVLLTQSWSDGSFLLRFVLRSENAIERIRQMVASLVERFPAIAVISVNIQPAHMAILEGETEIFLTEQRHIIDYFIKLRQNGFLKRLRVVSGICIAGLVDLAFMHLAARWSFWGLRLSRRQSVVPEPARKCSVLRVMCISSRLMLQRSRLIPGSFQTW
jgi:23S rRNA (uracil747-C5)-methyltransferase